MFLVAVPALRPCTVHRFSLHSKLTDCDFSKYGSHLTVKRLIGESKFRFASQECTFKPPTQKVRGRAFSSWKTSQHAKGNTMKSILCSLAMLACWVISVFCGYQSFQAADLTIKGLLLLCGLILFHGGSYLCMWREHRSLEGGE